MSKTFWGFLVIGLIAVAIVVSISWEGSKGTHLELDGRVLHVRMVALNPRATLVVIDFSETNPSDLPFVLRDLQIKMEGVKGDPVGIVFSKSDLNNVLQYMPNLGPKFNDSFGIGDRIAPHSTETRMVGARFELPQAEIESRSAVHIYFSELNRKEMDLVEKR